VSSGSEVYNPVIRREDCWLILSLSPLTLVVTLDSDTPAHPSRSRIWQCVRRFKVCILSVRPLVYPLTNLLPPLTTSEIADRYGPMDFCCLPISTGSSLSFLRSILGISLNHYKLTSTQHLNSWDAIQISKVMGSKASLAVHHSTFSPEDESRGNLVSLGRRSAPFAF
jgi:hypothetical protein